MELCLHEHPMSEVIFEGIFHTTKHSDIRNKQTCWGTSLKEMPPILLVYSGFTVPPVSQTH